MAKYLISACLMGQKCKYNGTDNYCPKLAKLRKDAILVCPEVYGGLEIPRDPCEIKKDKVISKTGQDRTNEYHKGAQKVLEIAKKNGVSIAILKENSPSCGVKTVYDGTFSHTKIQGCGITTKLLKENGIKVYSEEMLEVDNEI